MPAAYCTCGVQLVEDARFCHKCGRPTRAEYAEEIEEVIPPPLPVAAMPEAHPPAALPEIGFQNQIAVRICLVLAGPMFVLFSMLTLLPAGIFFAFAGLFATGFLAVLIYRRRTGSGLSVISGARLGWIAGIFIFVIALVVVTFLFAMASSGDLSLAMEEVKKQGRNAADVEKTMEMMGNPSMVLLMLVQLFVMFTTVPSLGGALGAKVLDSKE